MWFFPFQTCYLKTSLTRKEIRVRMLDLAFLSDADYRKTDSHKKYFYGELSSEDFDFQTIQDDHRLVPYCSGTIRGAGDEMYVFLHLKAFKVRRLYIALLLFFIAVAGFVVTEIWTFGTSVFRNPPFYMLLTVMLALAWYMINRCARFWKISRNSLEFFRGLLQAETVSYRDIPIVFKL